MTFRVGIVSLAVVFSVTSGPALLAATGAKASASRATAARQWTVFIAQDKHLDYGWCGTTAEIEVRMVALLDYYLDLVERTNARWNIDGTVWLEVHRRHRGALGAARLLRAIRDVRLRLRGEQPRAALGALRHGVERLDVAFDAGPVTALKVAEDGRRVIVRFWNVQDRAAYGSLRMPPGWAGAVMCNALERPLHALDTREGRVTFPVEPREIATLALVPTRRP